MSQQRRKSDERHLCAAPLIYLVRHPYGCGGFGNIQQEGEQANPFTPGFEGVGRAGVLVANLARVSACQTGNPNREGKGAQEVGDK